MMTTYIQIYHIQPFNRFACFFDEFVGKFPGAQPLFSHLRRKNRRMLALDSDESGSEAPWLGSLCWSVVRAF